MREVNKVINGLIAFGIGYAAWKEHGFIGVAGVAAAAWAVVWWQRREDGQRPSWKIDKVVELVEDAVIQNRIAEYERDGRSWLRVEGKYLHWEGFFEHSYWKDVNNTVRSYAGTIHAKRAADNASAGAGSLPYRVAMQARLEEHGLDCDPLHWARLAPEEKVAVSGRWRPRGTPRQRTFRKSCAPRSGLYCSRVPPCADPPAPGT